MYYKSAAAIALTVSLFSLPVTADDDKLPKGALPLSEVVKSLEDKGYSQILEASIDDGVWEVEVLKNGKKRELKVNPVTKAIISDRPDH